MNNVKIVLMGRFISDFINIYIRCVARNFKQSAGRDCYFFLYAAKPNMTIEIFNFNS